MDDLTRREIDKVVWSTLKDAGLTRPPVRIEDLLEHLRLNRTYYDLRDPGFCDKAKYKLLVAARKAAKVIRKINLVAVLFQDEKRIVIDANLPAIKQDWPSFHECAHRIMPWHRAYFHGDTAQTLDPAWQERLEAEANFGASGLMFCGPVFTRSALDTKPEWASVKALKQDYGKSYVTTLRRYVEHGPTHAMAMLVSTAPWDVRPDDQPENWRHFVGSPTFLEQFSNVTAADLVGVVNANVEYRRGGPVADFSFQVSDDNVDWHEFRAECFYNSHYILTLLTQLRMMPSDQIVVPSAVKLPVGASEVRR